MKVYPEDGFTPGMQVQTSMSDGEHAGESATYAEGEWRKSLSEIAFGRDLSGIPWDELKPGEKRAINELAQSPATSSMLESLIRSAGWPESEVYNDLAAARGYVQSVDLGSGRGSVVIPPGYENRKARRAAQAQQKRKAFKAYRAGRREGLSHETALQALADPRGFAEVLQREIAARKAKEQSGGTDG